MLSGRESKAEARIMQPTEHFLWGLLRGRVRVVAGAVANVEGISCGSGNGHLHAVEVESRRLVMRIVAEQILRAQIFADS